MSMAERMEVTELTRQYWPGTIINNISSASHVDALQYLRHSQDLVSDCQVVTVTWYITARTAVGDIPCDHALERTTHEASIKYSHQDSGSAHGWHLAAHLVLKECMVKHVQERSAKFPTSQPDRHWAERYLVAG